MAVIKPAPTKWSDDGTNLSPKVDRDIDLAAGQEYKVDGVPIGSHTPEGTAIKSTGVTGTVSFLRADGDDTCSWQEVIAGDFFADGSVPMTGTLQLAAGTTAAAPMNIPVGVSLTTPVVGAIEFDGTNLYITPILA